jgi:histidine ammonia-lyase
LDYVERVLTIEINSATDNPLIFEDGDGYRAISGGNFHGQYIAQAMDLLAMAVADLGSISERRLARLLDPAMSYGLPRNLATGRPGLNTGFVNVQCTASALVMENRGLSTAGSVDSIPGKGNAEDHVSNSAWCARKARTVVGNSEHIVAGELLCAAQALSLVAPLMADFPLGRGTQAALDTIRTRVPAALDGDRWFQTDMSHVLDLVRTSGVMNAVEEAVGALE